MVGKHNKYLIEKKANQHYTKWSLRKLSIGVASVAIASGFFIYSSLGEQVAHADDTPAVTTTGTDNSSAANTATLRNTSAAETASEDTTSSAAPADSSTSVTSAATTTVTTTPIAGVPTSAENPSSSSASSSSANAESGTMENPIVADAIADGYIKSQTDATNAANTLSGRAWIVDHGTPATMSNGLQPMPDGTQVYLRWMDTDGAVSPIYSASIKALGASGGSQVGPGAYAFDLRDGWTDVNGKLHKYRAVAGQYYKLWIPDANLDNGNTLTMIRQVSGFYPGSWVNSVTSKNLGQFPLIGTNMQRTGIYMTEIPAGAEAGGESYMTLPKDQWIEDSEGALSAPAVAGAKDASGSISGSVWLENGGDTSNSATGPNYNGLMGDAAAVDYTVVASMLTDEGARVYQEQVESLAYSQQATAAKTLLTEHPEYIAATVYGKTNEKGNYTLRFPKDVTWKNSYIYMFVLDKNGNLTTNYSSYTSPLFRSPNANASWVSNAVPAYNAIATNSPTWYNVNFATVNNTMVTLDITNHNSTTNPAFFGDTANVKLEGKGSEVSPLANYIQWTDQDGNKVGEQVPVTLLSDGSKADLTISQDGKSVTINGVAYELKNQIKTGDVFTATLYEGNDTNPVAKDSFAVTARDNAVYTPAYKAETVAAGQTIITVPTFTDYDGNAVELPEGVAFSIDDSVAPGADGWATLDKATGQITYAPNKDQKAGNYYVPVTVTYQDGTSEVVNALVTVTNDAQDYTATGGSVTKGYGEATTVEDVINNVTTDYPGDQTNQPTIAVDDPSALPDGQTPGEYDVPVTVTYPDGTKDTTSVQVTVLDKVIDVTDNPGAETPAGYVRITLAIGEGVEGTGKLYDVKAGEALTVSDLPTITAKDGYKDAQWPSAATQPVTATTTFTATATKLTDTERNTPSYGDVDVSAGSSATTDPVFTDQDGNVVTTPTGTTFTNGENTPGWTTVDSSTGKVTVTPGNEVPSGEYEIPVTVTYPDGTTDTTTVHVTITNDAADYNATGDSLTKAYGEPTTAAEAISKVTTNYPADKAVQPTIAVDDPSALPDGQTPGEYNVPVTVTYPDGTKDTTSVQVTVLDKVIDVTDNPGAETPAGYVRVTLAIGEGVEGTGKLYDVKTGEALTASDLPTITAKDGYKDAQWPDAATQPVTETTTFTATATKIPANEENNPLYKDITVSAGSDAKADPIFTNQDGNQVTPPAGTAFAGSDNAPSWAAIDPSTGTVTVAPGTDTPSGEYKIPVTVTYPDGSSDTVDVNVAVTNDAADYNATGDSLTKAYGEPTTAAEAISKVTTNYPADKAAQPTIAVDDPSALPDGQTPGEYDVPVTVTYPDGTTDSTTVKVTVLNKVIDVTDNPGAETPAGYVRVTLAIGEGVEGTGKLYDIKAGEALMVSDLPTITAQDGYKDAQWPSAATQPVTVSTIFTATATKLTDAERNTPSYGDVDVPAGSSATTDPTFTDQDGNQITPPAGTTFDHGDDVPTWINVDPSTGTVTVVPETDTPSGDYTIPVIVTYPDGSSDTVDVHATISNDAADYEATAKPLVKAYGDSTTAAEVINQVTTNYPTDRDSHPTVSVDTPSTLPDGKTAGEYKVPVTVTYPDGTTDELTVTVIVLDKIIDVTDNPSAETPAGYVRITFQAGTHGSFAAGAGTVFDIKKGTALSGLTVPEITAEKGYTFAKWLPTLPVTAETSAVYVAQYEAATPAGQPITVTPGQEPNPSDGISNKDDLPDGTNYEWKNPVDTTVPGEQEGTIVVTYPDGSQVEVTVNITVSGNTATDNTSQTPAAEPQITAPDTTGSTKGGDAIAAQKNNTTAKQSLPQTGNENDQGLVLLGTASAFLALFGLAKKKKRSEEN